MEAARPPALRLPRARDWSSARSAPLTMCRQRTGNQFARSRLIENRDVVHRGERGPNLGAVFFGDERAVVPLVAANAAIAVDRHDQHIAQGARLGQTSHVPGMEQIETAVGEYNTAAGALFACRHLDQFLLRNNFPHGKRSPRTKLMSGSLQSTSYSYYHARGTPVSLSRLVFEIYYCAETLILVAPASCRRIAADRARTAGKMPAPRGLALHRFNLHL